ncbi:MAG: hypothetical protein JSV63_02945 [Candidatus Aenigmatarchaeota archaeon]|nr:MAG: hypothetical protein JSV63_02945 [Candidatus Aenigmarchaeota archaeon]
MKGMVNILYALALIIMLLMSLRYITPTLLAFEEDPVEIKLDSMVYTLRDSLEIAKLYLDNSARYSLYQAAYNNSLNGGLEDIPPDAVLHEGVVYSLWYDDVEMSPDLADFSEALNSRFNKNFLEYLAGYSIDAIFKVKIPQYEEASVSPVSEGFYTSVDIVGKENLVITRTTSYDEVITITKNPDISLIEELPYFRLFEEAKQYHNTIKRNLADCDDDVLQAGNESFCCIITAEVVEDGDKCMVKVEAVTRKKFLVWNGEDVAFEPKRLVFMDRAAKV